MQSIVSEVCRSLSKATEKWRNRLTTGQQERATTFKAGWHKHHSATADHSSFLRSHLFSQWSTDPQLIPGNLLKQEDPSG